MHGKETHGNLKDQHNRLETIVFLTSTYSLSPIWFQKEAIANPKISSLKSSWLSLVGENKDDSIHSAFSMIHQANRLDIHETMKCYDMHGSYSSCKAGPWSLCWVAMQCGKLFLGNTKSQCMCKLCLLQQDMICKGFHDIKPMAGHALLACVIICFTMHGYQGTRLFQHF